MNNSTASAAIKPAGKVVSLDAWRKRSVPVATSDNGLFVNISEDRQVNYGFGRIENADAPAVMMACLLMLIQLTKQVDLAGVL